MKLYIDESGNTGETLSKDSIFNFKEQPYYVLAGILADDETSIKLESFITTQKAKHHIQGNELKAKNIYSSKYTFVSELVDYIISNHIPFFIELMDKLFYLSIQLVDYFIIPYYSLPLNDQTIHRKRYIASTIGEYLNQNIYQSLVETVKENTNAALEDFYDLLINHFDSINQPEIKINIEQTKIDYFEDKDDNEEVALKKYLPIPNENPKRRLIHLLPNYNAFTNLIARAQKYDLYYQDNNGFEIIHDEQKQFDIIFNSAFETMQTIDTDSFTNNTVIMENASFNLSDKHSIEFIDSKLNLLVQVSDLIAGLVMRFWSDFISNNEAQEPDI